MKRIASREAGSASVEFVGVIVFALLAGMVALQVGVVGWVLASATDAARAASRAASLEQSPSAAAQQSLPTGLTMTDLSGGKSGAGYSYTVTVEVPSLIPMLEFGDVKRTVDMPAIS